MKCPYCGENNADHARSCSRCGKRLDRVREKKRERRIMAYGVFLVIVILIAGLGALFAISRMMNATPEPEEHSNVTISTPTPTPIATPEPTEEPEEEPEEEEAPEPEALEISMVEADRQNELLQNGDLTQVTVREASASSTIYQEGVDNNPYVLYDGMDWTSWQEGVDGNGIGETVSFVFDRDYQVRVLVLRLGNWYEGEDYYYRNNRPSIMTFTLGEEQFQITFPDERREFCLELSRDVTASNLTMRIDNVYPGYEYDDTCINEVVLYGA